MALERVGLGAIVTTDTKPMVKAMGQARNEMGQFIAQSNRVPPPLQRIGQAIARMAAQVKGMATRFSAGAAQMGAGIKQMGMGLIPMGIGLGFAIAKAAAFEKQMSAVGSITRASAEDQRLLEKKAKQMGIVSAFSATEAAQGMEYMARAGATTAEIITGLDAVMDMAAADSLEMGAAADIVSQAVRGMGLEFSDATRIADVLALASSKVNTDVAGLGEALKYAMPTAKSLNMSFEETVAVLGKISDAGIKGSAAGTAFTNMMVKLAKPTSGARAQMDKWGISLTETRDGIKQLRPMTQIIQQLSTKLSEVEDPMERLAIAAEMTGLRGQKALNALMMAGEGLEEFKTELDEAAGSAKEMADRRLNNLIGKLTLFKSSLEGLAVGVFSPLLKIWAKGIGDLTDSFNKVLFALEDIDDIWEDISGSADKAEEILEKYGATATGIALGIRDATTAVGNAFIWLQKKIADAGRSLRDSLGDDSIRKLTKIVVIAAMIAGALAPAMMAGMMLKWVFGGLIKVLVGVGRMVLSAFWPIVIIAGIALIAWQVLKKENESFMDTALRVWDGIRARALDVWENVLKPMWLGIKEGFTPAIEELGQVWDAIVINIKLVMADLYEFMFGEMEGVEISWREVGRIIGAVLGAISKAVLVFVQYVIPAIASVGQAIYKVFSFIWGIIDGLITDLAEQVGRVVLAFQQLWSGSTVEGLKRLGAAVMDFLLKPLQLLMKVAVKLAEALGAELPQKFKDFAAEGFSGLVFGQAGAGGPSGTKQFDTRTGAWTGVEAKTKGGKGKGRRVQPRLADHDMVFTPEEVAAGAKKGKGKSKSITDLVAGAKGAAGKPPKVETEVNLEDNRKLDIHNQLCIEGEGVSIASARHQQEIHERSGFKSTPWQRRAIAEHGALPMKRTG